MQFRSLWIWHGIFFGSFAVLLFYGTKIYQEKPPIPSQIVTEARGVIYTEDDMSFLFPGKHLGI